MVHMRSDGANFVFLSDLKVQFIAFLVEIFNGIIQLVDRMDDQVLYCKDDHQYVYKQKNRKCKQKV